MFETEAEVYEAMGLTPPEEPEAGPTGSEDEVDVPDAGAEQPEEEPGGAPNDGGGLGEPAGEDAGEGEQQEDPFAEQRKEMSRQHKQELEQLRREHQQKLDAMAAGLGLRNPYDGNKPISTQAELEAYQQRSARERLKAGGLNDEQLAATIAELPELREAAEAKAEAQRQQELQRRQEAQRRLQEDVAAVGRLCPEIRSAGDLVAHASYPKVRQLLQANPNMGVLDAFRLANFDALTVRAGTAAAQRARNQSAGKNHLAPTQSRGAGQGMTREQEAMYRKLLPGASREEIQKFHQENMRGE